MSPKAEIWSVSEEGLLCAINWAVKKLFYSIDRPNMNRRGITESLDDKIMGDVATVAVLEYLAIQRIPAVAYDQIRVDNFQLPDPGWDIAIGTNALYWSQTTTDTRTPVDLVTASVKSSRLPRSDKLIEAIRKRDFKIFAKPKAGIEECITSDIEMQVYYKYTKSLLGNREIRRTDVDKCLDNSMYCNRILQKLNIQTRYAECALTAWNYKTEIVRYSQGLRSRHWSSYGKQMWIAPLRFGRSIADLKELLG